MRSYETMFILQPTLEEEQQEEILNRLKSLIEKEGGEVTDTDRWGLKRLAYEIKKFQEGFYYVVNFIGSSAVLSELERYFRLTDKVLRYLIVQVQD